MISKRGDSVGVNSIDVISGDEFVELFKRQYHLGCRFCFILGAGASVSSGIPTGKDLMKQWQEDLWKFGVDFAKANAEKANISWDEGFKFFQPEYILQSQDYFLLFDLRFAQDIQEGYRFLEDKMESKVPNIGYSYLGYILKNTENHLVITTNFDHLLEEALQQLSGHYPLVIGHELMSSFMNDNLRKR